MAEHSVELDSVGNITEYCDRQAREIESEIERMGIVLGIDWTNDVQVRALAKESLEHAQDSVLRFEIDHTDYQQKAKATLFALAYMMLDIMAKSSNEGIHTHGGVAWKAFSIALMQERGIPIRSS
jgi:predicted RNA-binding protein Jag